MQKDALVNNGYAPSSTSIKIHYRWLVCTLLFLATTINYMDRQILSLLKPLLDNELHWSNAQYGLVNSTFQGAYALSLLGFGWFVDRFGPKLGYAVSITAWSLAALAHAFAGSFGGFLSVRLALGLGEGGNFPAAIKTVTLWFPKKERALATSIFNAGANVGAIIAPAIIPFIAISLGWQAAFIGVGLLGLLWLLLWWPLYHAPDKIFGRNAAALDDTRGDRDETPSTFSHRPSWSALLGYRQTWSFIMAKFCTDPIWWFILIWLPDFFKQTRGLDLKQSWLHLTSIYAMVTVLSILGGWLSGYLNKRGLSVTWARKSAMLLFALCVVPIFSVTRVNIPAAVALIGLAGAAHQAWSATLFTTVSDMFPQEAVASVIGIGGMAGALGGMLFPIVTGLLLDHCKASGDVTSGYTLLFTLCAGGYLVAFLIHHMLAPSLATIRPATAGPEESHS